MLVSGTSPPRPPAGDLIVPTILLVGLLLGAPVQQGPTGLTSSEKSKATKIITRYFKEWDQQQRRAILKELEPLDHPSAADIRSFRKLSFKLARTGLPKQRGKSPFTCKHPDIDGTYIVRAPSRAKSGAKAGVFISLHGSGGSGGGIARVFGTPDSKLICVYPTTYKTRTGWNAEEGIQFVTAMLDELKRTYKVDTNRVYIAGHSMGGFGTWSIGGRFADLFAAAAPMAGGTWERGVLPNYRNLPLRVYNAEDDNIVRPRLAIRAFERINDELRPRYGGYPAEFHLYPPADRVGHGFPRKRGHDVKAIFSWMLKHERDPRPTRVVWEPALKWKRHFYWLHSQDGSGVIDASRKGNTFTISGGRGDLAILLNDKLCDLSKPVTVTDSTNDDQRQAFRGKPTLSLRVLVESIGLYNDPDMTYVAAVKVR